MLKELKSAVYYANMELDNKGLVIYTWGNVSGISDDRRYVVIKPSGVSYDELKAEDMVVVDTSTGNVVEGNRKPSSDTETHLELYRSFKEICGITHTHSVNAVAFAQAGKDIPALGTTHADYFYGCIPCTRELAHEEIMTDYELNTGKVIVECFRKRGIDPATVPGVLVKNHGPFCWGNDAAESVYHAVVMDTIAEMAIKTITINAEATMSKSILDKHYYRKHGKDAYYGQ